MSIGKIAIAATVVAIGLAGCQTTPPPAVLPGQSSDPELKYGGTKPTNPTRYYRIFLNNECKARLNSIRKSGEIMPENAVTVFPQCEKYTTENWEKYKIENGIV